jgi:UPF0271 protein
MVVENRVTTISGRDIEVIGHTLCLHGDTVGSVQLARQIRAGLLDAGVEIRKLSEWF